METTVRQLHQEASEQQRAIPCPVCECQKLEVLLTPEETQAEKKWLRSFFRQRSGTQDDKVEFTQDEAAYLVRCPQCGTLLREPQPTQAALTQRYARDTYDDEAFEEMAANQERFFTGKFPPFAKLLPEKGRLLEIGSFTGAFLTAAQRLGFRCVGLDIGKEAIQFMREKGLEVIQGDVCEVELPMGEWDGVFIWNTFDQLADSRKILKRVHALLKPGALVVLRVPNGAFKRGCLQLQQVSNGARTEHLRRAQAYNNFMTFPYLTGYTPESITTHLGNNGFRIERMTGDTILTLADRKTPDFARKEEQRYKRAVVELCDAALASRRRLLHPWMDIVARAEE